jgi:acetylornithine deacetylase
LDTLQLCEALVGVDSVSARPNRPVCERIADELQALGARVEWQEKEGDPGQVNVLGSLGPEGAGGLALLGHADTVPWDRSMRATDRPERDGRRLYGRGACDMKGGIAAMLVAARAVDARRLGRPLRLAFTFQEEVGCHGIKHMARVGPLRVEHAIIGEPTGLAPVTMHKGYVIARYELRGQPCHSSDPRQGVSAIRAASRAIDETLGLAARFERRAPSSPLRPPWTTINVGLVSGGSARNVVPEHAGFTVELRPAPGEDGHALLREVDEVARAAARAASPGVEIRVHIDEVEPPLGIAEDRSLVRFLAVRSGRATTTVPFYTEGPAVAGMGATVVVLGPGEITQAHRHDEWVDIDALAEATEIYRDSILEFCT